jgi:hypothetical protein
VPPDIQDYVQPDTQIEPSIAVNPANPLNAIAVYQEGRIANGGDATNGYATTFDGGKTWKYGELPGLTTFPGQGGDFDRASDAVVAFGPNKTAYANSLVFDVETGGGLRSGMAVNVSKDGGKTWSKPAILQDDQLGGLNDKNWIVVDNSDAPGHTKGRVYVVWDRVAPVVYDYCDHDCEDVDNWLPNLQTVSPVVFPGQGIGAYPMILKGGGLGIVIDTTSPGAPTEPAGGDEPELEPNSHVFISAPAAGSTPYPSPLTFTPPIEITANRANPIRAQRASDGLPAAAVDPKTGALYAVFDDGRLRSDVVNDAMISMSTDDGATWSPPKKVNPGGTKDGIDHFNVTVAVGDDSTVHVAYRQRDESGKAPLFSPTIDTFYQQSRDAGKTFSAPLKVDRRPSLPYYGAFSRNGTFEGDYNQTASAGGYTYVTRSQGQRLTPGEPPALTPNKDGSETIVLEESGKGHQHQRNWVALIQDRAKGGGGGGACIASNSPRTKLKRVRVRHRRATVRGTARDPGCAKGIKRVQVAIAKHVVRERGGKHRIRGFACRFASRKGRFGRPVKCSKKRFVRAKGTSKWVFRLKHRLRGGHYDVWARSVTRSGFREPLRKRNHRTFVLSRTRR